MNYEVVNGSVVDEGYLMTGHLQVTAWRPEKEREREKKKKKRERERLKQTLFFFQYHKQFHISHHSFLHLP